MSILCLLSEGYGNEWQLLRIPMPTRASTAWVSKEKQNLNAGNVKKDPVGFISLSEIILESQKEKT